MKTKFVAIVALVIGFAAGSLFISQAQGQNKTPPAADPRIDKIVDQNDQILKNQEEILKQLADLKEGVTQLRRRTS